MTCVLVPRDKAPEYWFLPWSDVLAAAKAGTDGLSIRTVRQRTATQAGFEVVHDTPRDFAALREGDKHYEGRTFLYRQNW